MVGKTLPSPSLFPLAASVLPLPSLKFFSLPYPSCLLSCGLLFCQEDSKLELVGSVQLQSLRSQDPERIKSGSQGKTRSGTWCTPRLSQKLYQSSETQGRRRQSIPRFLVDGEGWRDWKVGVWGREANDQSDRREQHRDLCNSIAQAPVTVPDH